MQPNNTMFAYYDGLTTHELSHYLSNTMCPTAPFVSNNDAETYIKSLETTIRRFRINAPVFPADVLREITLGPLWLAHIQEAEMTYLHNWGRFDVLMDLIFDMLQNSIIDRGICTMFERFLDEYDRASYKDALTGEQISLNSYSDTIKLLATLKTALDKKYTIQYYSE